MNNFTEDMSPEILLPPIKQQELPDLAAQSVILNLKIESLGRHRSIPVTNQSSLILRNELIIDADPDLITAAKTLLDSTEVKAIKKADNQVRIFLRTISLPAHQALRKGFLRIPITLIRTAEQMLERYTAKRATLVEDLIEALPTIIERDKERLGIHFNIDEYPSAGEIRQAYAVSYQYLKFVVPEVLAQANLLEQERQKATEQMRLAVEECQNALRTEFAQLISHATKVLTVAPGEQPKVFRNSLIENMNKFLTFFEARDLTDDTALAVLVEQAREIIKGIPSAEVLRTDREVRTVVATAFQQVQQAMDEEIVVRPRRKLRLEDDK